MEHSVKHVKLRSGAEGLFIDVPSASVVSFDMAFRAGDYLSPQDKTDTAHVMEHLVLGANKKYPSSKEFSKEFTKFGAYNNAYTGDYFMGYEAECEAGEAERILDLLCIAIESPLFTDKEFRSEIGNVREELKMRRNNEEIELSLKVENTLGLVPKTYSQRVQELANVEIKDVSEHYKKTHFANNLRFVIAGPVSSKSGSMASRIESMVLPKGPKMIELPDEKPANLPSIVQMQNSGLDNLCYRYEFALPLYKEFTKKDSQVMLFEILFNGFQSRVFGELRERGLAYGIFGSHYETKNNIMCTISGQVQNDNFNELLLLLKREISNIADKGITQKELSEAKKRTYGETQRHHQTVSQISAWYRYGFNMRGEINPFEDFKKRLKNVDTVSVQEVAQEILSCPVKALGVMFNPEEKPNFVEIRQNSLL